MSGAYVMVPATWESEPPPLAALQIWCALWVHSRQREGHRTCWPSIRRLAEATGLTARAVVNGTRWLSDHNLMKVTKGGGRGRCNSYELLLETVNAETLNPNNSECGNSECPRQETVNGRSPGSRVIEVEEERGSAAPPGATAPDTHAPKAPTRELIDLWKEERGRLGLGPEQCFARHGRVFADLFSRANQDVAVCRETITLFFREPPDLAEKNGRSIGTFQAVMDRVLERAIARHKRPLEGPGEVPDLQAAAQTDADWIRTERTRREAQRRADQKGSNGPSHDS